MNRLKKILSGYGLLANNNAHRIAIGWEIPGFSVLQEHWIFAKVPINHVDSLCDALETEPELAENLWNIIQKFGS